MQIASQIFEAPVHATPKHHAIKTCSDGSYSHNSVYSGSSYCLQLTSLYNQQMAGLSTHWQRPAVYQSRAFAPISTSPLNSLIGMSTPSIPLSPEEIAEIVHATDNA